MGYYYSLPGVGHDPDPAVLRALVLAQCLGSAPLELGRPGYAREDSGLPACRNLQFCPLSDLSVSHHPLMGHMMIRLLN